MKKNNIISFFLLLFLFATVTFASAQDQTAQVVMQVYRNGTVEYNVNVLSVDSMPLRDKSLLVYGKGSLMQTLDVLQIDSIMFQEEPVVNINGVAWATCNVDAPGTFAAQPEDAGMFYQWNRKTGWDATGAVSGWDNSYPAGSTWDKSNNPCPDGWRLPALADIQKLCDTTKVASEWVTQNSITGRKFTDKTTGNSIFLPAPGYGSSFDGMSLNAGTLGNYWSSTTGSENLTYYLYFSSDLANWNIVGRHYGRYVRAVAE